MIELRLHGVGDHKPQGALGSPQPVPGSEGGPVGLFRPPPLPPHDLLLAEWSRTSRRKAGFLWYLALPFTLVNAAGHMGPTEGPMCRPFRTLVHLASLLVTASLTIWMLTLAESVISVLPWQTTIWWTTAVDFMVIVALVLTVVARLHIKKSTEELASWTAWAHLLIVVATFAGMWLWRPAQKVLPKIGPWDLPTTCTLYRDCPRLPTLDFVTTFAITSLVATMLIAASAWLLLRSTTSGAEKAIDQVASPPGCALALVSALVWIHAIGSLLVLAVSWAFLYPRRYPVIESLGAPNELRCGGTTEADLPWCERILLVPQGPRPVLGSLPSYVLAAAVSLLLGYLVAIAVARRKGLVSPFRGGPLDRARHWHSVIAALPWVLPWMLLVTAPLATGLCVLMYVRLFQRDAQPGWTYALVITASHAAAVAVVAFIALGRRSPRVRQVFGSIADVLGFWPIRFHPLAGSSYRDDVVQGLTGHLDSLLPQGPVVLVGHSQGSVLCAWASRLRGGGEELHLVTCGSPLASLYGSFFPHVFSQEFFDQTTARVSSWGNFWRDTDPIASPLYGTTTEAATSKSLTNVPLPDTAPGGPRAHSDYWIEDDMISHIAARPAAASSSP